MTAHRDILLTPFKTCLYVQKKLVTCLETQLLKIQIIIKYIQYILILEKTHVLHNDSHKKIK